MGVSPASHSSLGKSLLSSCVGTELGEGSRPTPPVWQDLGPHPQGTCSGVWLKCCGTGPGLCKGLASEAP